MTDEQILEWFNLYGDRPVVVSDEAFVFQAELRQFASMGYVTLSFDKTYTWDGGYKLSDKAIRRIQNETR